MRSPSPMHPSPTSIAPPWSGAVLSEKVSSLTERSPLPRSSMPPPDSVDRHRCPPLMVMWSTLTAPALVVSIVMLLAEPWLSSVGKRGARALDVEGVPSGRGKVDLHRLVRRSSMIRRRQRDGGVGQRLGDVHGLLDRLAGTRAGGRAARDRRAVDVVHVEGGGRRRRRGGTQQGGEPQAERRAQEGGGRREPGAGGQAPRARCYCRVRTVASSIASLSRLSSSPIRREPPVGQLTLSHTRRVGRG